MSQFNNMIMIVFKKKWKIYAMVKKKYMNAQINKPRLYVNLGNTLRINMLKNLMKLIFAFLKDIILNLII